MALLKKAASSVLTLFPCSRTEGTFRAQKRLMPCWTNVFEQRLAFGMLELFAKIRLLTSTLFGPPKMHSSIKRCETRGQISWNQQGLSLLEIVMAMAVVFLALLGFAGFSVVAHTGMSESEKMTRAVTLAQEKMEDVKREGMPLGLTSPVSTTESYGTIAGASHHQRMLTIAPNDPMPGLHTITVIMQWDNGAHATSLKTYLMTD